MKSEKLMLEEMKAMQIKMQKIMAEFQKDVKLLKGKYPDKYIVLNLHSHLSNLIHFEKVMDIYKNVICNDNTKNTY